MWKKRGNGRSVKQAVLIAVGQMELMMHTHRSRMNSQGFLSLLLITTPPQTHSDSVSHQHIHIGIKKLPLSSQSGEFKRDLCHFSDVKIHSPVPAKYIAQYIIAQTTVSKPFVDSVTIKTLLTFLSISVKLMPFFSCNPTMTFND